MAAYFIFSHTVIDADKLNNDYLPRAIVTMEPYELEILVVDQEIEVKEGDTDDDRTVVLKFVSREQALDWYHSEAYQAIIHLRQESTRGRAVLCDAFDLAAWQAQQ